MWDPADRKTWLMHHVLRVMVVVLFIVAFGVNWLYEESVRAEIAQRQDAIATQLDGMRALVAAQGRSAPVTTNSPLKTGRPTSPASP